MTLTFDREGIRVVRREVAKGNGSLIGPGSHPRHPQTTVRDTITFHDHLAHTWEAGYDTDRFSVRLSMLSSLIPQGSRAERWLDAGCGTGTLARWLARERNFSVVAIDASAQMLFHASPEEGVEYRQADILKTGLSACSFDGMICSSVLEYLPSVETALEEFHRILKPGGTLIASVPNSAPSVRFPLAVAYWLTRPLRRKCWFDYSRHSFSAARLSDVLQQSGFTPVRMTEFGVLKLPLGMRLPTAGTLIMVLAKKTPVEHDSTHACAALK